MKALKFSLVAALLLIAPTAYAQSTVDTVKAQVFSAVEKRLVREYFGAPANQQTSDSTAPEWAVKDQREDDDGEDDNEDGDKQGKKDKGKKDNKGKKDKGKSKGKSKGLPPGLAKRDQLPPGLQRQLERNGRLPAGLAKRDLPADLMSRLPRRTSSQEVTVVDNDVVLLDKATGVILDVIKDVVTNGGGAALPSPGEIMAAPSPQTQQNQDQNQDTVFDSILKSIFGN